MRLSEPDRQRIDDAITEAERHTTGEIFCVLAREVSNYREVPLGYAAIAAPAFPALMVLTGLHDWVLAHAVNPWSDGSFVQAQDLIVRALAAYAMLQSVIFVSVALLFRIPAIRRAVTPGFLRRIRVQRAARNHFDAHSHKLSDTAPHVLIFVSLLDRRVELIAHDAIHRVVGQGPWDDAVRSVTLAMRAAMRDGANPAEGYVRAIAICGEALARHFPAGGENPNLLPNAITEI